MRGIILLLMICIAVAVMAKLRDDSPGSTDEPTGRDELPASSGDDPGTQLPVPGSALDTADRTPPGPFSEQPQVVATNPESPVDRASWSPERWRIHHLESFEARFHEASSVELRVENAHALLMGSIAAILDAQGRYSEGASRFPANEDGDLGFLVNGRTYRFSPGEFPEYEALHAKWSRLGKKLLDGEASRDVDSDLESQILSRMSEARLILESHM